MSRVAAVAVRILLMIDEALLIDYRYFDGGYAVASGNQFLDIVYVERDLPIDSGNFTPNNLF